MPVLVTGATGLVGRALAARLVDEGAQVRAYLRRDDRTLRAAGVHIAVGAMDDVPRLESALTQVHTLVHLVGGIWPEGTTYDLLNRDSTEAAVIAANAADVARIVFLSFVGADPGSANEFLSAKAKAEQHVRDSGLEHAIFRCAPVWEGLERTFARLTSGPFVTVPGTGSQRMNPIALTDVIDAIVAADSREAAVAGTWDLGGPVQLRMEELVERFAKGKRRSGMRALSGAPKAMVEVYGGDMLADPTAAVEQFGLRLARVR